MNSVIRSEVIKRPLRHQQEAINSIHAELTANDRATAAMACGTGKTLLALWVAERLNSKMVVVLVPSIALIDQFLREWVENVIPGEIQYLAVCSDSSKNKHKDWLANYFTGVNYERTL